ncbi:MAG: hypothetical protein ACOC3J_01645 [Gemmatimonadota bacterium]
MRARLLVAFVAALFVAGCEPMMEPRLPEDDEDEEAPGEETGMIQDTRPTDTVPLLVGSGPAVLA